MERCHRILCPCGRLVFLLAVGCTLLPAQEPFLEYDFEDGSLDDFFNPTGVEAIVFCGDLLPSGPVVVEDGEVLFTNDELLGITVLSLRPETVEDAFPESRDYKVRCRVSLETITEFDLAIRCRLGVLDDTGQIVSSLERAYNVTLFPEGVDFEFLDGVLAVAEFTGCHELVPHEEWAGGEGVGYARVDPGVVIAQNEWYWLEAAVQGDDDGGAVTISAKVWIDGDDAPDSPQVVVVDENGLNHTVETLAPENDVQVIFGTSLGVVQEPLGTARMDDLSITSLGGCEESPFLLDRTIEGADLDVVEGEPARLFEEGESYSVMIRGAIVEDRADCPEIAALQVEETVPAGWGVTGVSPEAVVEDNVIRWNVPLAEIADPSAVELTYEVEAAGEEPALFRGEIVEEASDFTFLIGGDDRMAPRSALAPISDFGSIQHWLVTGPFGNPGGNNPGEAEIVRDWITDGEVTEATLMPRAGETIEPDFGGEAASTELVPDLFGRNPGGVATWIEWKDLDDADDRIDFESIYGDLDNVMCYAVTYLDVLEAIEVNFGVSSDDSVHVLLDGETLHANSVPRGALERTYQDTLLTHENLGGVLLTEGLHTVVVKVFEGGGDHNFRLGFTDEFGVELTGGPEEISVVLDPGGGPPAPEKFVRADCNLDSEVNLTDGIFLLNFLFLGGPRPDCEDACDNNGDRELNITNGVYLFNFLFLGGPPPPEPYPDCEEARPDGLPCGMSSEQCGP